MNSLGGASLEYKKLQGKGGTGMILSLAIAVAEGIVLASDSRLTFQQEGHWRIATDYADKLISLDDRYLVNFAGAGRIGMERTAQVLQRFADDVCSQPDSFAAASHLRRRIYDLIPVPDPESRQHFIAFNLAGYDPDGVGRVQTIQQLSPDESLDVTGTVETTNPFITLIGDVSVAFRILWGVDLGLSEEAIMEYLRNSLQPHFPFDWYSVQDAIDLATFLLDATHKLQVFTNGRVSQQTGIVNVGGDTDVGVITPDGVQWMSRKAFRA